MSARETARVDVYKGERYMGMLQRTAHGASFEYTAEVVAQHSGEALSAVAFSLPVRSAPYEVFGTNLHPFFAGLLPEGLRFRALARAVKTSEDDLFTLLAASGADTVGDVCIAEAGARPKEHTPMADIARLSTLSFEALFEDSLRYENMQSETAVAGVQPKLSAAMITFPLRTAHERRSYIMKLTPAEYPKLSENEAFFMALAKTCGFEVARTKLVHDVSGRSGLLVERFDRVAQRDGSLTRLHQEDACQLLDRYPADKYRLTLAEVSRALEVCSAPMVERLKLLRLQAFAYLIANGDLHAKNVSVQVKKGTVALTPVYDVLSTLPYGDRSVALSMEGRDEHLKTAHFCAFGERVGLRRAAVEQMLTQLVRKVSSCLPRLSEIGLDEKKTAHLERMMRERLDDLAL